MQNERWLIPEELLYDRNNYWVKVEGNEALIGLTGYGQSTTGDIIYLELPPAGTSISRGEEVGSLESGKWVGKLIPPLTGVVLETNSAVEGFPGKVNHDPYREGWLLRMSISVPEELGDLLDATAYEKWVEEQIRLEQEGEAVQ